MGEVVTEGILAVHSSVSHERVGANAAEIGLGVTSGSLDKR